MRALILRPLCTVALVVLGFFLLRSALQGFTQREFQGAHDARVVVFGDSHGNDVPLRGVPRFNRQAQDLVSTWLRMRALADAQGPDSQVEVVVLTLWPMKFGPLAEDRMSGAIQPDGWHQSVLGKAGPLLGLEDFLRAEWPWRLKWQLFLHSAQLESVRHMMGWVCRDGNLADDYAAPLSDRVKHSDWFQDAHLSTWAFSAILDLVEDAGWQLVILENPLHPSYLELANKASLDAYLDLMHVSAEAPHVHYLHMGWDTLPNSAFFDFHHLSCEGMAHVQGQLDPLLEGLLD